MNLNTLAANTRGVRFIIHQPDGQTLQVGGSGPAIDWYLHAGDTLQKILRAPRRELPRRYLRGEWDLDGRYLPVLLQALTPDRPSQTWLRRRMIELRGRLGAQATGTRARHWQESSLWLSRICLGEELHQGCGHYRETGISLEQAQRLRCRDICARLQLQPGQKVLDISAGWGSLALYMAGHTGASVTGRVRTREQLQFAHSQARQLGLEGEVQFHLGGLRECHGRYDRIIGNLFDAVPPRSRPGAHLAQLAGMLRQDGMLWLQVACRQHPDSVLPPGLVEPPGLPAIQTATGQARLRTLGLEDVSGYRLQDLRDHLRRYHRRRSAISRRFGERCTRYWEFLLASETAAIERGDLTCCEILLGNTGRRTAPAAHAVADSALPLDIARRIPGLARDI